MSNTDKALNLMTTSQRRVCELVLSGDKQQQIATKLKISQSAVSQAYKAGIKRAVKRGKMLRK